MTKIFLIRHTQAEGNLYHMMQGHWDGGVTPLGKKQIEALAARFRGIHVDAVYSSDLYRAMETATAVTRYCPRPLITDKRLREINVGPWEAQFFGNAIYAEPELFRKFISEPDSFQKDGAETYAQVQQRAFAALSDIVKAHPDETVAIVSHGITIRCLVSGISGISLEDLDSLPIFRNTSVSLLYFEDGRYSIQYLNDCSHLPAPGDNPSFNATALRHEYIDPREYERYYKDSYADSWLAAHGTLSGYSGDAYYASALEHYAADPESVCIIYDGDKAVGLVDMDTQRGAHANYGWISLLYLTEEYRHQGLGIQLLARAIVKYEALGRRALRLHVSEDNAPALAFYRDWGFKLLSSEPGSMARLHLMERPLEGRSNA